MQLKKFLLFGLMAAVLPAVAEEAADRKTATSLKYVTHELDTRQDKFTAEQNKAMEYTDSAGTVQKRAVTSNLGSSTSDTSLPMVGGVNTKLATKQDDIAPINDHTAVTYTGTTGKIGAKGIYQDTGTYIEQSNNLIDAKTFNAALKKGLDSEFLCSEYKPGTDLCWVYSIHNNGESRNLFDKTNNSWIFRNRSLAATMDGYWYYANGSKSLACPCEPNTTYTVSGFTDGGSIYRFATIDTPTLPTTTDQTNIPYSFIHRETTNPGTYTFTTPATAKWIVVQTNSAIFNSTLNTIQIEKGSTATAYQEAPYTTLVPSDYTPVEYITFNGAQELDTGFTPNQDTKIVSKFMGTTNGSWVYGTGTSNPRITCYLIATGNERFGNVTVTGTGIVPNVINELVQDKHGFNFNGNLVPYTNVGTFTCSRTLTIGNSNGSTGTPRFSGNFYEMKVYDNDVLVRNYIPARKNSDNSIGLYDSVNNTFLSESALTAGPDINNIIYIPQNQ